MTLRHLFQPAAQAPLDQPPFDWDAHWGQAKSPIPPSPIPNGYAQDGNLLVRRQPDLSDGAVARLIEDARKVIAKNNAGRVAT